MKSLINTRELTRSEIIYERLSECIHNGEVENTQLWQTFSLVTHHLGLCSPAEYAKRYNVSDQYAHRLPHKVIFGAKIIIDND